MVSVLDRRARGGAGSGRAVGVRRLLPGGPCDRPADHDVLTVNCFGVRIGDMCLYRPKRDKRRIWPLLVATIPWSPMDAPGSSATPTDVARRDPTAAGGIAARAPRAAGVIGHVPSRQGGRHTQQTSGPRSRRRASTHPRPRTTCIANTTNDTFDEPPTARPRPRYITSTTLTPSRAADPPPISYSLLLLMLDPIPLAPPLLRPSSLTPRLSCLPRFVWQVEEGGPARQRWTPFLESPGVERSLGPEAGRRRGDLLRPPEETTGRDHYTRPPA
jgi:hypothetical protein